MATAAEKLEGRVLDGGWAVGPIKSKSSLATGGNFSQSYEAVNGSKAAFVKALDFDRVFASGVNFPKIMQEMLQLFNFEVDMLEFCEKKGMDRVVRAIGNGIVDTDGTVRGQVPYLIFEAADRDIRKHLDDPSVTDVTAWKLRSLHHITTGLKQLHCADVAHQDIKPSNVLIFDADKKVSTSKLGDLGRASRSSGYSPFDHMDWAGDPKYAPPEVQYGFIRPGWHERRIGYDLYMLGSVVCFLFSKTTSTSTLLKNLPTPFWPGTWNGSFDDVLPYLANAFADSVREFSSHLHPDLSKELTTIFEQLCSPDPRKRGCPGQALNKLALERYISIFDRLALAAECGKFKAA